MEPASQLVSRPGPLLRGASAFGLLSWLGILFGLTRVPGIEGGTYLSALAMAGLFAALLLAQSRSWIRAGDDGVAGRTPFRRMRCGWAAVKRVEVRPFLPGVTIFLLATERGPLVFTSLWRNHRELLVLIRERAALA